jgi:hypothetical protein
MRFRRSAGAIGLTLSLLTAAIGLTTVSASAFDDAMYPDLKGQWRRISPPGQPAFDPNKPRGWGQEAPLTEEYKKVFEENIRDLQAGGEGLWPGYSCRPPGMPPMMTAYEPLEIVILPKVTFIMIDHIHESHRRIHTDGRDWPKEVEPRYAGYTIGRWVDTDGDGKLDTLEAETRHIKGRRAFDATGLPLHADNKTVVKERIYLDKANRNMLRNEITVIDNALTRPWSVIKSYSRAPDQYPFWREYLCSENNNHIAIGKESYFLSADGFLMPAKKGQAPPDLRHFGPQR